MTNMTLLDEVMSRLGREYAAQGKSAPFQALKPFLDSKNAQVLPSYEVLANQLQVTLGAVKTLIHRLRKQHAYLLRQEVARTVCDPREVDEKISTFSALLSRLSALPINVPFHSIIGNRGINEGADSSDGIVAYRSSHLEGAETEKIVTAGHNLIPNPITVAEIKRILQENIVRTDSDRRP
jgi:hypothetical protein